MIGCAFRRAVQLDRTAQTASDPPRHENARLVVMSALADSILEYLRRVDTARSQRDADPTLAKGVEAIKAWQHDRLRRTYADLLDSQRYAAAARFFLNELYGPADFARRDAQFARVVPALVRMFPTHIVDTVRSLAELHALSEDLDNAMAQALVMPVTREAYVRAWQTTGRAAERETQIALVQRIGRDLEHYTCKPLLRHALKMMRGPARATGLDELQHFLEAGFDTFAAMGSAQEFLGIVGQRERVLAAALFEADPAQVSSLRPDDPLGQLP